MSDCIITELLDAKNKISEMADEINNKEKEKLFCLVDILNTEIGEEISKVDIISQEYEIIKNLDEKIRETNCYTEKFKTNVRQKIDLKQGEYSMTCMCCNTTCHYPCTECGTNNDDIYKCSAMKNGYCQNCFCNCHWTDHRFVPYRFEFREIEKEVTCEALKKEHYEAKRIKQLHEQMLESAKKECKTIHGKISKYLNQCKECVNNLQKNANGPIILDKIGDIEQQKLIDKICGGNENDILQRPINLLKQCGIDTSFI